MELPVGPAVARDADLGPERHARHQPPGAVVAELHRLGHARARSAAASPSPSASSTATPFGEICRPAPTSASAAACSKSDDPRPPPRQRRGRREAADPAADDGDLAPREAHAGGSPAQAAASRARIPSRSTGRGFQ